MRVNLDLDQRIDGFLDGLADALVEFEGVHGTELSNLRVRSAGSILAQVTKQYMKRLRPLIPIGPGGSSKKHLRRGVSSFRRRGQLGLARRKVAYRGGNRGDYFYGFMHEYGTEHHAGNPAWAKAMSQVEPDMGEAIDSAGKQMRGIIERATKSKPKRRRRRR